MPNETQRVVCRNLAPWDVSFQRKTTLGDVIIPPNAKIFLDSHEILAQCYSDNRLFTGTDGKGAHAQIYIDNAELRKELAFDSEDGKETQMLLDDDKLEKLFAYKQAASFEKAIRAAVVVHYERFKLIDYIKRAKVNDYQKIRFVEEYVGARIEG